ncbi:hypothetical protein ABK040_015360 [Willaertia magna]
MSLKTVTLNVNEMACEGCAGSVRKLLKDVAGVDEVVEVNVEKKSATLKVNSNFNANNAIQKLSDAGFPTSA